MTAIAGLVHEGSVYIGGDSAAVGGCSLVVRRDPKVFRVGEFLIGYTSSYRMGQVLRYGESVETVHFGTDELDPFEVMVKRFIPAIRTAFKGAGFAEKHNEAERGGCFLVGFRGRLFSVGSDYQVGEAAHGFDAAGCGEDLVRGALFAASRTPIHRPDSVIETALQAAEQFSAGVRGPFVILKL
jgi:ATP-dependent protease HslVU (ClpYQ) peptidase subunit